MIRWVLTILKASKPLMEKRRRARINHCLAQLKSLVVDPNTTERSRQTKLEKADILELTVRHLHEIKRRQRTVSLIDAHHPKKKFEIGYSECAREVDLFLSNLMDPQLSGLEAELQRRLKDHLCRRLHDIRNIEPLVECGKKDDSDEMYDNSSPSSSGFRSNENSPPPQSNVINCSDQVLLAKSTKFDAVVNRLDNHHTENEHDNVFAFNRQSVSSTLNAPNFTTVGSSSPESLNENIRLASSSDMYELDKGRASTSSLESDGSSKVQYSMAYARERLNPCFIEQQMLENSSDLCDDEGNSFWEQKGESDEGFCNHLQQIPLVPKRLPNGEWALVLPANLISDENNVAQTFSAFRLVWPSSKMKNNTYVQRQRQNCVASPVSSNFSDTSSEENCSRSEGDSVMRSDQNNQGEASQYIWRPW
ncbi:uncharacterized protein LOC118199859 isoform X2 [Stegodyphus dumicola]|uniref:uncharacterized protein LOC118199859 isoform X2 n=1 Tax=Stegodyphus dumicola TaxID=202533 RepID=UPI0015A99024|nr:uncharacterized protein LOC118199859 isoform X2 [Stegodyphus dumicola]